MLSEELSSKIKIKYININNRNKKTVLISLSEILMVDIVLVISFDFYLNSLLLVPFINVTIYQHLSNNLYASFKSIISDSKSGMLISPN